MIMALGRLGFEMARDETQSDLDEQWLYQVTTRKGIKPAAQQVDAFIERVAILICDANIDEPRARTMALEEVLK